MLTVSAPAKLNLFLHILGRRSNGYHDLDSLFAFVPAIADQLTLTEADSDSLTITGPFSAGLPTDDNLVLRALIGLRDLHPSLPHYAVTLEKNLPVAAGLGGGSADAGAVLRLLTPTGLAIDALALALGADVPACLAGRPLLVEGIGEIMTPAHPLPLVPLVLANPRVPLSTASVFKNLAPPFAHTAPIRPAGPWPTAAALIDWLTPLSNDLEPTARRLCPAIDPLLALTAAQPGCRLTRMAGSGPSIFGLFDTVQAAKAAARALDQSGAWARAALIG